METEDQPKSVAWTWVQAAILVPALLLYLLSLPAVAGLGQSDRIGNSVQSVFAGAVMFLLWLLVAAFVALSCRRSKALLAVGMVLCLYGLAISIATTAMANPGPARITPAVLPLVALVYAVWVRFATDWPWPWRLLSLAGFFFLTFAAAAPFHIEEARWEAAAPQREAEYRKVEEEARRAEAEQAAQREAEYWALGLDSRLEQFFPWVGGEHDDAVMAMIRNLHSRQADAVRLLDAGTELPEFRRMPEFGLAATPELCASYRRRIERKLAENSNDTAVELATYVDNFRWLHANSCPMADLAAREAALLRRHPNDGVRADAATFDAIR